jgi:hypothetical protein
MWDLATQPRSLVMLTFGLLASAAVGRMARSKAAKAAYRPYSINTVRLVRARATLSQAKPSKTSQVKSSHCPGQRLARPTPHAAVRPFITTHASRQETTFASSAFDAR